MCRLGGGNSRPSYTRASYYDCRASFDRYRCRRRRRRLLSRRPPRSLLANRRPRPRPSPPRRCCQRHTRTILTLLSSTLNPSTTSANRPLFTRPCATGDRSSDRSRESTRHTTPPPPPPPSSQPPPSPSSRGQSRPITDVCSRCCCSYRYLSQTAFIFLVRTTHRGSTVTARSLLRRLVVVPFSSSTFLLSRSRRRRRFTLERDPSNEHCRAAEATAMSEEKWPPLSSAALEAPRRRPSSSVATLVPSFSDRANR